MQFQKLAEFWAFLFHAIISRGGRKDAAAQRTFKPKAQSLKPGDAIPKAG
jgi:hypothetical protein